MHYTLNKCTFIKFANHLLISVPLKGILKSKEYGLIFVETIIFTRQVSNYLDDEQYREFQNYLAENPTVGDMIQGTGGLRKVRWSLVNKGKRGGVRVIYYWQRSEEQIYLMTIYAKNEMKDLSNNEKKILKQMIEKW